MIQAGAAGQLNAVKLLVSRGAGVGLRVWVEDVRGSGEWRTALKMAQRGGDAAVVDFLVSAGARD